MFFVPVRLFTDYARRLIWLEVERFRGVCHVSWFLLYAKTRSNTCIMLVGSIRLGKVCGAATVRYGMDSNVQGDSATNAAVFDCN